MYIVAIAWMYVALMMAVAEATSTQGTVLSAILGAFMTFIMYGVLPVSLVVYLMRSPGRKRAIKEKEALEVQSFEPNTASHAPAAAELGSVAPVREKS